MSGVNAQLVGQVACGELIDTIENIKGDFVLSAELCGQFYGGIEAWRNGDDTFFL